MKLTQYAFIVTLLLSISTIAMSGLQTDKLNMEYNSYKLSLYNTNHTANSLKMTSRHHSPVNIASQAIVSPLLGAIIAIPTGILAFSLAADNLNGISGNVNFLDITVLAAVSGYIFGAGVGVYAISTRENKILPFWKTIGFAAIGAGGGMIVASILSSKYTTIPKFAGVVIALTPVIGAMIYTNFIADWIPEVQETNTVSKIRSHADFLNSKKLCSVNIIKIAF